MIYSDYRFLLDVHDTGSQESLSFKQGDTGRVLYITLTEDGKVFELPANCVAVFTALKPDGTIIFNDCEINGNEIKYAVTPQSTVIPGKQDCELRLYGAGNSLITSPHFTCFVHPTVYADNIIESKDEVNTLTNLIYDASTKLANGDFVPKLTVGTVTTLPAGNMATVEIEGPPEAPVLNFAIPQGDEGQAEHLIPDTELSTASIKPVQNNVIALAIAELSETIEKVRTDNAEAHNDLSEEITKKVAKEEGKGLSANDYTNTEKQKLAGIEAGANKYTLPVGGSAIGGVKNGGDIVIDSSGNMTIKDGTVDTAAVGNGVITRAKLAQDALYSPVVSNTSTAQYDLTISNLGKTIYTNDTTNTVNFVFALSKENSEAMPVGTEIAIAHLYGASVSVVSSEVRFALAGESGFKKNISVKISETFGMIAIKKLVASPTYGDIWLVTGNVEVVV